MKEYKMGIAFFGQKDGYIAKRFSDCIVYAVGLCEFRLPPF